MMSLTQNCHTTVCSCVLTLIHSCYGVNGDMWYPEEVAHASLYATHLPPKIAFLHIISESKQACFRPTVCQRRFYWSALALEAANRRLSAQGAARTFFDW